MKLLFITLLFTVNIANAQNKFFSLSKSEISVMACEFIAGHSNGWREEVLYHPNALFERFPNLNRKFWDSRISWQDKKLIPGFQDANHMFKFINTSSHLAAITISIFDKRDKMTGKEKVKYIVKSLILNYASYQLGFFTSYNLIHKNRGTTITNGW